MDPFSAVVKSRKIHNEKTPTLLTLTRLYVRCKLVASSLQTDYFIGLQAGKISTLGAVEDPYQVNDPCMIAEPKLVEDFETPP